MKRFWIALSLLIILLAVSLGSLWYFSRVSESLLSALSQAEELADHQDLEGASSAFYRAGNLWKQQEGTLRYFLDREEMGAVEGVLASCQGYLSHESLADFSAGCRQAPGNDRKPFFRGISYVRKSTVIFFSLFTNR